MESLPKEIVIEIAQYLTPQELSICCGVSHEWRFIFDQNFLWVPHCNDNLEEYLRTTPCKVEPAIDLPIVVDTTLSPACQWRQAFMRENHLWNNWRLGNFKMEMREEGNIITSGFITNDYMFFVRENEDMGRKIELWDVKEELPCKVSEMSLHFPDILWECHSTGKNMEMLVIQYCTGTKIFCLDTSNHFILSNAFYFQHLEKISLNNVDVLNNMFHKQPCEDNFKNPAKSFIKDNIFFGFIKNKSRNMHIWDLETGLKLKEECCPQCEPSTFFNIKHSDCCNYWIIIVIYKVEGNEKASFGIYLYNTSCLSFLPVKYTCESDANFGPSCAIMDRFIAFRGDDHVTNIYNFQKNELIVKMSCFCDLRSLRNNFIFSGEKGLHIFNMSNQILKYISDVYFVRYNVIADRFVELIPCCCGSEVWKVEKSLKPTRLRPKGNISPNKAFTKFITVNDNDVLYLCCLW